MSEVKIKKPTLGSRLGGMKRRAVRVSGESLVREEPLSPDRLLPLVVTPAMQGVSLTAWASDHRQLVEDRLAKHGGILFRGFGLQSAEDLDEVIAAVSGESLEYRERSSPRTAVAGNIYTSTDYPPNYPIFLHNENSYQAAWPLKIFFYCHIPAETGGETPIADCRRVYQKIRPEVREKFAQKGWMYVRNFGDGFGLDWKTVFQTSDKAKVEAHCAKSGIEVEWKEGGRLRTRARRQAVARHPLTGEMTWFNHATFFHITTLEPEVREALLAEFDVDDLPTNTCYGDGTPIETEVLEHLREVYASETVAFPWQKGDVMLLDNMNVAHGRAPFTGERKVLVGMAQPMNREQLESVS
ncbi:MAG: TauD/TfdA family dioxygenase [Acidobacteriota bacterium]|nr:TauD/TfdA family dioxygenase [Acidobacteriota bacterium]